MGYVLNFMKKWALEKLFFDKIIILICNNNNNRLYRTRTHEASRSAPQKIQPPSTSIFSIPNFDLDLWTCTILVKSSREKHYFLLISRSELVTFWWKGEGSKNSDSSRSFDVDHVGTGFKLWSGNEITSFVSYKM